MVTRPAIDRVFLGATHDLAEAAAPAILDRCGTAGLGGGIDLSGWLFVLPGERAIRLLLRAMLAMAGRRGRAIDPPRFCTPGSLIEAIHAPAEGLLATATQLERRIAWESGLADADRSITAPLLPADLAESRERCKPHWRRLALHALRVEDELSANGLAWTDAVVAYERSGGDAARIAALATIAGRIESRLREAGVAAPHDTRAALLERGALRHRNVVLAGVFELARIHRSAVAKAENVLALVGADPADAKDFDDLGCATTSWTERRLSITPDAIQLADAPRDQAEAALRFVAELSETDTDVACDDIAIGLADEGLAPTLVLAARDAGLDVHDASGVAVLATRPGRLLAALSRYRASRRPEDFAALLRHPLAAAVVSDAAGADPLAALDSVRESRLPAILDQPLGPGAGEAVRRSVDAVDALLARLDQASDRPGAAIIELLDAIPFGPDDEAALAVLRTACAEIDAMHASLRPSDAGEAWELLLELASHGRVPAEPRERSVEALGWLELPFEPAPNLVVLGMNEGHVPAGGRHDPFLPDSIRARLGMPARAERVARDAAILELLVRRSRRIRLVAGRTSVEGEPLTPSRLLLTERGRALGSRVRLLFDRDRALRGSSRWRRVGPENGFAIPMPPEGVRQIARMSVTDFRVYLKSPMRFWLQRVERLEPVSDDASEIPLPDVGTLVHSMLQGAAKDGLLDAEQDPRTLAVELHGRFERAVGAAFGTDPLPGVRLQLQSFRPRIDAFAAWQAAQTAAGWNVRHVERPLPDGTSLTPERGSAMALSGRIDRIDFHPRKGRWRIIDYKTADSGKGPREAHVTQRGRWLDLQLPLYHYGFAAVLREEEPESTIDLGYVRMPSDPTLAGFVSAEFSPDELDAAVAEARRVVQLIRDGKFELGSPLGPDDPFAIILQAPVFGGADAADPGDAAEASE